MSNNRRFRVLFRAETYLRLMEKPGDPAGNWRLPQRDATTGAEIEIVVRDVIEVGGVGGDLPIHQGVTLVVTRPASDLDEAIASAGSDATVALALMSGVARAPTAPPLPMLAYDVTPDESQRRIRQWFRETPIVLGKAIVPEALFGEFFQKFVECSDTKLLWRLTQSLSWHQRGLREADEFARFMALWIACEALEPRLRELFNAVSEEPAKQGLLQRLRLREPKRSKRIVFPGLKALAEAEGADSELVKRAYTLRNDLFHARRVTVPEMRERATKLLPGLESLLPSAWLRLLGMSERTADFPPASVMPSPVSMIFDAVLVDQDEKQWSEDVHPHFDGTIAAERKLAADTRDVTVDYPTELRVKNATEWRPIGTSVYGPGPRLGSG